MNSLVFKIVYDSTTTVLDHSPDGWDEGLLNLSRQEISSAIFRSYTIKLGFVKDGAHLLRSIFYNDKVDAVALLEIWKLNRITLEYEQKYEGSFDFSSFKDEDNKVSVVVTDNTIGTLIKANGKTKYGVIINADSHSKIFNYLDNGIQKFTVAYTIGHVFSEILNKVTGGLVESGLYNVDTTNIDSFNYLLIVGGALRTEDIFATIRTSINDYLEVIFILTGMVMDVSTIGGVETVSFVPMSDVYSTKSTAYHISNISNFSLKVDADKLFSSLKIGYEQQDFDSDDDELNGKYETNGLSEFTSEIIRTNNVLDMTIKYRGDWTSALNIMISPDDTSNDEQIYILAAWEPAPDQWYLAQGRVRNEGSEHSLENSSISPKRLLIKHIDYISSLLDSEGTELKFNLSSYRNYGNETRTILPGATSYIDEFTGITLSAPVFFKPYIFEFEAYVDDDFFETMVGDTSQYISFDYRGNTFTGFLIDTKIKLHGKSKVKIKMISSADNDLTNLINLANNPVNNIEYDLDFSDANNANLTTLIT